MWLLGRMVVLLFVTTVTTTTIFNITCRMTFGQCKRLLFWGGCSMCLVLLLLDRCCCCCWTMRCFRSTTTTTTIVCGSKSNNRLLLLRMMMLHDTDGTVFFFFWMDGWMNEWMNEWWLQRIIPRDNECRVSYNQYALKIWFRNVGWVWGILIYYYFKLFHTLYSRRSVKNDKEHERLLWVKIPVLLEVIL